MANKRISKKTSSTGCASKEPTKQNESVDYLSHVSPELLCKIMDHLPLREVLCLSLLSKNLLTAVNIHLALRKIIHFNNERLYRYFPSSLTDDHLILLLKKCPAVEYIYGLNPRRIETCRLRRASRCGLTIPGVIVALGSCKNLKGIETSHLKLMEAVLNYLPQVEIVGHFRNHNGRFPIPAGNRLVIPSNAQLTSLHLTGIEMPDLQYFNCLQYIYLQWVRFTKPQPFKDFLAPNLETFVMRHCIGPGNPLRFVPLTYSLAQSTQLKRLELVGMPFLGRLFQRVVDENIERTCFRDLEKLSFGACRNIVESDVGYLLLASSQTLVEINLQPSLSRDSLLYSLKMAEVTFPNVKSLSIGYVDDFPSKGLWTRSDLLSFGLDDVVELPAPITDAGLQLVDLLFPSLTKLLLYNCPHLVKPRAWCHLPGERSSWKCLTDLHISFCHCLRLEEFLVFLDDLPKLETLILEDVFREPPKGCSYVGLSAGTGLGMSSAIVGNRQDLIAVHRNAMEGVGPILEPPLQQPQPDYVNEGAGVAMPSTSGWADSGISSPISTSKCEQCGHIIPDESEVVNTDSPKPSCSKMCTCESKERSSSYPRKTSGRKCPTKVDKACMTLSDDIRQEMRAANGPHTDTEAESTRKSKILTGRSDRYSSGSQRRRNRKRKQDTSNMLHKSVGTSDPILEDDHSQALNIVSDTLASLTVISCGISEIGVTHCSNLQHIDVETCRILKTLRLRRCSLLTNVIISQCPKVILTDLVKQMSNLPPNRNRLLFIQPFVGNGESTNEKTDLPLQFPPCDLSELERAALHNSSSSYNVCYVMDFSSSFDFRLSHRNSIWRWMKLVTKINKVLLRDYGYSKNTPSSVIKASDEYPWGRRLTKLHGDFIDGTFSITTDMPWIRDLWASPKLFSNREWHGILGSYRPLSHNTLTVSNCINALEDAVYERRECDSRLSQYSFTVYVHVLERNSR
ncbi:F-box only protein 38 [Chamberlinius hualienensis]